MKKKSEVSHTPTPWKIATDGAGCKTIVIFDGTYEIASHLEEPDAAFIVKAVNAHEELLNIVKRIANFDGCYGAPAGERGEPMDFADYRLNVTALMQEARKAIANSEGK